MRAQRRLLPLLVNCALIVAVAYSLAQLSWQLLAPADAWMPPALGQTQLSAERPAVTADADAIASWHLFGKPAAPQQPAAPAVAPETRLDLRLAGIFHSEADSTATTLALIAAGGGLEKPYRVGDQLAADVRLERIEADQVVLARAGGLEILRLPRDDANLAEPPPVPKVSPDGDRVPAGRQIRATELAARLRSDQRPDSLQDIAYATPYLKDGQFVGLRLKPGRQRRLLAQLGLRAGDVLTELNGTRLTDASQGTVLLQELLSADQVRAKVLRNGAEMPFTFVLADE